MLQCTYKQRLGKYLRNLMINITRPLFTFNCLYMTFVYTANNFMVSNNEKQIIFREAQFLYSAHCNDAKLSKLCSNSTEN